MLIGVLNQTPLWIENIITPAEMHFSVNTPARLASRHNDQYRFLSIFPEAQSALKALATEGIQVVFSEDAVAEIARIAAEVNGRSQNIGARRLHTIMERVLDQISFEAPDMKEKNVTVDADYVRNMLAEIVKDQDLSRYIL